MRGAVPCLSADLTTHAVKKKYAPKALNEFHDERRLFAAGAE